MRPTYEGTYASGKYSPLEQIHQGNVRELRVAWRWRSPDHDIMEQVPGLDTS